MPDASLSDVAKFFRRGNEPLSEFAKEWKALDDKSKEQIKKGIGDGTYNY